MAIAGECEMVAGTVTGQDERPEARLFLLRRAGGEDGNLVKEEVKTAMGAAEGDFMFEGLRIVMRGRPSSRLKASPDWVLGEEPVTL